MAENALSKREFFVQAMKRLESEMSTDSSDWNLVFIDEKMIKLNSDFEKCEAQNMAAYSDEQSDETTKQDCLEQAKAIEHLYCTLKSKLRTRIAALSSENEKSLNENEANENERLTTTSKKDDKINTPTTVEIDKFGGIEQFDKFEAQIKSKLQENTDLSNDIKFDSLVMACVGTEAERIVLMLSENNFEKAFEKLKWLYGSCYKQAHHGVQKLLNTAKLICPNAYETVSLVKQVDGILAFLKEKCGDKFEVNWIPLVIIEKMDMETRYAWERQCKVQARSWGESDVKYSMYKFMPDWQALKSFLMEEAELQLQYPFDEEANDQKAKDDFSFTQENKSSVNMQTDTQQPNASAEAQLLKQGNYESATSSHAQKYAMQKLRDANAPSNTCPMCPSKSFHPLYKCTKFLGMTIFDRVKVVSEHKLCMRCFYSDHSGPCADPRSNKPCDRCKPALVYHNSTICEKNQFIGKPMMKSTPPSGANNADDWSE